MHTALFTHTACLKHDMGDFHPESPARLRAVLAALETEDFMFLDRREAPEATVEQIAMVHPLDHVKDVLASIPQEGIYDIDGDTSACPHTGEAALRAAGSVIAAVDAVMKGEVRNAFCAVRPPGHHAEPNRVMGFCFFNNAAIGAAYARETYGLARVAVVDFDVHHGNGTQACFEKDPSVFYASTHQTPLYPGTGAERETGVAHNIVNVPLPPLSDGDRFRHAWETAILPSLRDFSPEFLIISAGFDAHAGDPLAQLRLTESDFIWITKELMKVADEVCGGRIVSTLEGGYDTRALARSVAAHVQTLMEG